MLLAVDSALEHALQQISRDSSRSMSGLGRVDADVVEHVVVEERK